MGNATFFLTLVLTTASSLAFWGTGLGPADAGEGSSLEISARADLDGQHSFEPLETRRGEDGRLHITARINGMSQDMMVDTAATHTVLNQQTASLADVTLRGEIKVRTAGGYVIAQRASIGYFEIGKQTFKNQDVLIIDELPASLLGMDVLQHLEGRYLAL